MSMASQFSDMMLSSIFCDIVLFLLSSLVTGPSLMSISSLALELWQFSFIRDWPEIRIGNTPSDFCPISGDWNKLGIPNLARMSLIKCYWMLQNARVTAFTASEGKPIVVGKITPFPPPNLGLKKELYHGPSIQTLIISPWTQHILFLFKLFFHHYTDHWIFHYYYSL